MARLKRWIGASAGDVVVRLSAQMLTTIVLARMLPAEDFGISLMVLSVVAVLGNFVSLPFEEALAQRPRLTSAHLETALFVSLVLSAASFFILWAAAPVLARLTGVDSLTLWMPVAALFLVGHGPGAIARALMRRHRRFVGLAWAQSLSVLLASFVAIGLAFGGSGVFALVTQRMVPIVLLPALVIGLALWRGQVAYFRPRWNAKKFRDIGRFSWIYFLDVTVDYATPAILTFIVNAHFGTAVVGQINIAMKIVEPLRAAIGGVGHNLVFSLLKRHQTEPAALCREAVGITANVSSVAVAVFLGLAVTSPLLLPIVVGPGWEAAVPISRAFCVAAAISVPFRYLFTGYLVLGRPEISLVATVLGMIAVLIVLQLVAMEGQSSLVGWAMTATEAVAAALGIGLLFRFAGRDVIAALLRILRIWVAAGLTYAVLDYVFLRQTPIDQPALALAAMVLAGMAIYPVSLMLLCRQCFRTLVVAVNPKWDRF